MPITNAIWAFAKPTDRPAGRWDGQAVVMINYNRPLRQRMEARRSVGPYVWIVPALDSKSEGRGFYFDRSGNIGDATFSLRISEANDALRGTRLAQTTGYYADEDGDSTIVPYVVALPHGRGFWPAYGEGPGMWGAVDYDTYETAEEAARAAHALAERAAEREREFREEEQAKWDAAEAEEAAA
jgi:hypothetical protein